MESIASHAGGRGRGLRYRLAAGGAAVAVAATLASGLAAAPAGAVRNDPCATARAAFRAAMNEARFWIGAADRLAAAGNDSAANQASDEAGYYLGLAEGALGDMSNAC